MSGNIESVSLHLHVAHVGVAGAVGHEDQVGVFPARARHLEDARAVGLAGDPVGGGDQVSVT